MTEDGIVLSEHDAKVVSGVLELYIASNLVREAPHNSKERLEKELQELNSIQGVIENQLDVSSDR